jgi:hypothetical protein
VEGGRAFDGGPCSLLVSVNGPYAVVLEGQEEGEASHKKLGVYERAEGKAADGGGVCKDASLFSG